MAHDPASPPPGPPDPPGPLDRLDSWKDIATHLRRDVSTVQRWEKREQMPVHRHLHDKLGSVYAFRSELDAWSRGRAAPHPEPAADGPDEDAGPADRSGSATKNRLGRGLVVGGLGLVLAAGIGAVLIRLRPAVDVRSDATAQPRPSGATRPVSAEAEDLSQRARYLSVRTTDGDNQAAIALLEKAIALEPGFARAHAELASAFVTRLAYVSPEQTLELEQRAFAAAERALSLDPNVPEAYLARGDLLWTQSHRFAHERALQEFRRALALNPNSDEAHRRLARVLVHIGLFDDALRHADQALAINPSNAQALNSRAQALLWMGRVEEALAILLSIPGPVLPELVEANTVVALQQLGRREEAWTHLRSRRAAMATTRAPACAVSRRCSSPTQSHDAPRRSSTPSRPGMRPIPHITRPTSWPARWRGWGGPARPSNGCGKPRRLDFRVTRSLRAIQLSIASAPIPECRPSWPRWRRRRPPSASRTYFAAAAAVPGTITKVAYIMSESSSMVRNRFDPSAA